VPALPVRPSAAKKCKGRLLAARRGSRLRSIATIFLPLAGLTRLLRPELQLPDQDHRCRGDGRRGRRRPRSARDPARLLSGGEAGSERNRRSISPSRGASRWANRPSAEALEAPNSSPTATPGLSFQETVRALLRRSSEEHAPDIPVWDPHDGTAEGVSGRIEASRRHGPFDACWPNRRVRVTSDWRAAGRVGRANHGSAAG
jgi:hypothetical protein